MALLFKLFLLSHIARCMKVRPFPGLVNYDDLMILSRNQILPHFCFPYVPNIAVSVQTTGDIQSQQKGAPLSPAPFQD